MVRPGSTIIGERENQGACTCHREGGRERRKEGSKCSPYSVIIAAAVWQCHHDEGVCLYRKELWAGGSWDKASRSSLEWGKTWLGLCRGRNLKIQAEWHSCWLVLHVGSKEGYKEVTMQLQQSFHTPSAAVFLWDTTVSKGKGSPRVTSLTKTNMYFSLTYQPYRPDRETAMSKSATKFSPGLGFIEITWHPEISQYGQVSLGFGILLVNKVVFRTLYSTGSSVRAFFSLGMMVKILWWLSQGSLLAKLHTCKFWLVLVFVFSALCL